MTQHKHLKQLIRDRMKKTGQRYASARRSILQAAPIPNTPHRPGCNAAATALRILLANAGQNYSEPMVFGVAGGVGIGVFTFCYEKEDFASFFIAGRHCWHDHLLYLKRGAERFGATTVVKESTSPKTGEKQLREVLDEHGVCVAWVDLGALPHRGMPSSPMVSGYHLVTVYSADDKSALIGDLTDDPIEIGMKELTAARGRIKKDKNRLLALTKTKNTGDMKTAIKAGLKACHDGLNGMDGPANARRNFSLNALPMWAERLTAAKGADSWEKVFPPGQRLFGGLTSVCLFIEHYGTGGGLVRPLMADFLAEAGKQLGNKKLTALSETYRDISEDWSDLADAALPDNVPVLAECKELYERYEELCHTHGSLDEKQQCWARLKELQQQAAVKFPMSAAQVADLRATLAERVVALHEKEVAAQKQLVEVI